MKTNEESISKISKLQVYIYQQFPATMGHLPLVEKFADIIASLEDVCELRLCEQHHLILKPNQLYKFTLDENCEACKALYEKGKTS